MSRYHPLLPQYTEEDEYDLTIPRRLFISIETTGLPKKRNLHPKEYDNFKNARLIYISFIVCNINLDIIKIYSEYVNHNIEQRDKPYITHSHQRHKDKILEINNVRYHGITLEEYNKSETTFLDAVVALDYYMNRVDFVIAFDIELTLYILLSELHRYHYYGMYEQFNSIKTYCVKTNTEKIYMHNNKLNRLYTFVYHLIVNNIDIVNYNLNLYNYYGYDNCVMIQLLNSNFNPLKKISKLYIVMKYLYDLEYITGNN
jgi:hypothetical protein